MQPGSMQMQEKILRGTGDLRMSVPVACVLPRLTCGKACRTLIAGNWQDQF